MSAENIPAEEYGPMPGTNTSGLFDPVKLTHIVLMHNPGSRHAHTTPTVIEALKRATDLDVKRVQTSPILAENVAILLENSSKGSALFVKAGDGGTSEILTAAYEAGIDIPITPIGGGTKDDIAHMVHTTYFLDNPGEILTKSELQQLRPMVTTITNEDGETQTIVSFGYNSVGSISPRIANWVNSKGYRLLTTIPGMRTVVEPLLPAAALVLAESIPGWINGVPVKGAVDAVALRGNRMAGKTIPGGNEIFSDRFTYVEARNRRAVARTVGRVIVGQAVGVLVDDGTAITRTVLATPKTMGQHDGEEYDISGLVTITHSLAIRGVPVLSTQNKR